MENKICIQCGRKRKICERELDVNSHSFSHETYITHFAKCSVCGEGFDEVDEAIDAGTDLYVHPKCAKHWRGCWLNYNENR